MTCVADTGDKSLISNIYENVNTNSKWLLPNNQGLGRREGKIMKKEKARKTGRDVNLEENLGEAKQEIRGETEPGLKEREGEKET